MLDRSEFLEILRRRLQKVKQSGPDNILARCPFHDDRNPSFSVNLNNGMFLCFGCGARGGLQRLATVIPELLPYVGEKLEKRIPPYDPDPFKTKHPLDEADLEAFRWFYPASLEQRGFLPQKLFEYEVGWDRRKLEAVWTVRDYYGTLAGFVHRATFSDGKAYVPYVDELKEKYPTYQFDKGRFLWNSHREKNGEGPLVLAEGYKAALWILQAGFSAVASMGTFVTDIQQDILATIGRPVIIFFDNDIPGAQAKVKAGRLIARKLPTYLVDYQRQVKQPDDMTADEIKRHIETALPVEAYIRRYHAAEET